MNLFLAPRSEKISYFYDRNVIFSEIKHLLKWLLLDNLSHNIYRSVDTYTKINKLKSIVISHNPSGYSFFIIITSLFPCNYFVNKSFHFAGQSVSAFNIIKLISISKTLSRLANFGIHWNFILSKIYHNSFFGDLSQLFSCFEL
jgi:hypothetical protein